MIRLGWTKACSTSGEKWHNHSSPLIGCGDGHSGERLILGSLKTCFQFDFRNVVCPIHDHNWFDIAKFKPKMYSTVWYLRDLKN